jgi:hypothetical protein
MPTVTGESKAEFDRDFLNKKGRDLPALSFERFIKMANAGKMRQARNKKQELEDLEAGRTSYAELPKHTDEGDIYDLMDKGHKAEFIHGPDIWAVGKPESVNKAQATFEQGNWYSYGKLYDYPDEDIAHFYRYRHRQMQGDSKQADLSAFADFAADMADHHKMFDEWETK